MSTTSALHAGNRDAGIVVDAIGGVAGALAVLFETADSDAMGGLVDAISVAVDRARASSRPALAELLEIWQESALVRATADWPLEVDEASAALEWFASLDAHVRGEVEAGELMAGVATEGWWAPPLPAKRLELERRLADEGAPREAIPAALADPAVEAIAVAAAPRDVVWMSEEERALLLTALDDPWLPAVLGAVSADESTQPAAIEELRFQAGLLGNAFRHLGLEALAVLFEAAPDAAADPLRQAAVIEVGPAVGAWLLAFDDHSAAAVVAPAEQLLADAVAADWIASWGVEASSVRLGSDPANQVERVAASSSDLALAPSSDVLPSVMAAMRRELPGNAARLGRSLRRYLDTTDADALAEAVRVAHTLKGDANTVGIRGLANLSHVLEDLLLGLQQVGNAPSPTMGALLAQAGDAIEAVSEAVLAQSEPPSGLLALYQDLLDAHHGTDGETAAPVEAEERAVPAVPAARATPAATATGAAAPTADEFPSLDVALPLLSALQVLSGDALVTSRRFEDRIQRLAREHLDLTIDAERNAALVSRLDDLVALRGAALDDARSVSPDAVDPLELDQYTELYVLARQLAEADVDRRERASRIEAALRELDELRVQNDRLQRDLQDAVLRTLMAPFSGLVPRLERIVRQTARELGKAARIEFSGEGTLVEADLLDGLAEPLAHLLRNAVDHGLEDGATRRERGKNEEGRLHLHLASDGDSLVLTLRDDGRGFDLAAIRAKAESLGLLAPEATLDNEALHRLVLLPGFTTRDVVSQVSGRGIGMDVVQQGVARLGGRVTLTSKPGAGSDIRLRLPLNQGKANAIIVADGDERVALLSRGVERILGESDWRDLDAGWAEVDGARLPAADLASLFGGRAYFGEAGAQALLLLGDDGRRTVLRTPAVRDVQSVVLRPLPEGLRGLPAVRGITVLGDGLAASVVDAAVLVSRMDTSQPAINLAALRPAPRPEILIADDSLSVRRSLAATVEDAGYRAILARDGLEAIECLNKHRPVVVLVDLEMPRMNGLDVTRHVRNVPQLQHLPVIMITSRASGRQRELAEAAGVDAVLGKPFDVDELLAQITRLLFAR
jgi:chemotaxis protein histidine kinase CheA